jgi:hypothetical protein
MMRAALPIALLLLAGCADTYGTDEGTSSAGGVFTKGLTESDTEDFFAVVAKHSGDASIRESNPAQFTVTAGETDCYLLVTELEDKPYVASIGACQPA